MGIGQGNGITVIGTTFVDIKGYPFSEFIPAGRNAGRIIEVQGDDVSAEFRSGNTGDPVPVPGLLENSNEALAFYLSYSGVDLIWVHVPPKSE